MFKHPDVVQQCLYGAIAALVLTVLLMWASLFGPAIFSTLGLPAVLSAGAGIAFLTFIFDDDSNNNDE